MKYYPLSSPYLKFNENKYVSECIQSEWISSSGKYIEKLSIENGKLNYQVTLDSLVLKETISINRIFLKQ